MRLERKAKVPAVTVWVRLIPTRVPLRLTVLLAPRFLAVAPRATRRAPEQPTHPARTHQARDKQDTRRRRRPAAPNERQLLRSPNSAAKFPALRVSFPVSSANFILISSPGAQSGVFWATRRSQTGGVFLLRSPSVISRRQTSCIRHGGLILSRGFRFDQACMRGGSAR